MSRIARAAPGVFPSEHFIRYHLPQERGWAYVHTHLLAEGLATVWPASEDNKEGRWWETFRRWFGALRKH